MKPIIVAEHVSKWYPRHPQLMRARGEKLLNYLIIWFSNWRKTQRFQALDDINLRVFPGETVGLIGSNGSGKSTLLRVLTGISEPTSGRVYVRGEFRELFAFNAGFNLDVSGRKNIYLYAAMKGIAAAEIDEKMDAIIKFSGLGNFIDEPVKTYSTGMRSRLGFSLIVNTLPDIIFIDEALSAGDESFREKCNKTLMNFKRQGRTLVIVSHNLGIIKKLCNRIIWLEGGKIRMDGSKSEVFPAYQGYQRKRNNIRAKADPKISRITA